MKKNLLKLMLAVALTLPFASCVVDWDDNLFEAPSVVTYKVEVELNMPDDYTGDKDGITVAFTASSTNYTYRAISDENGVVTANLPADTYDISASSTRTVDSKPMVLNGVSGSFIVTSDWDGNSVAEINLALSEPGTIIIKELYTGGCQKDDGSGSYTNDNYVILYNNGASAVTLDKFGLAMSYDANSSGTNYFYSNGSGLDEYSNEEWFPAYHAVMTLGRSLTIEPYSQVQISLVGAIDHTLTYSNSVNQSNADLVLYDPTVFTHSKYVAPSSTISSSDYITVTMFGLGTGWMLSTNSPTFVIFNVPDDVDFATYAADADNTLFPPGASTTTNVFKCLKMPRAWVLDGMESFRSSTAGSNSKRLTADVDAGFVYYTATYGYSLYRNVDKEATEAIASNSGKIVYGYTKGTKALDPYGSTDSSNIDAEASISAGAKIVYKDTNYSTNDFHQRSNASWRR